MPNFDRTGPQGAGPMTGGAHGLCGRRRGVQTADPALAPGKPGHHRGNRHGFGRGRSCGDVERENAAPNRLPRIDAAAEVDPAKRRAVLKAERNRLKWQLREVEETLKAIGRDTADNTDA